MTEETKLFLTLAAMAPDAPEWFERHYLEENPKPERVKKSNIVDEREKTRFYELRGYLNEFSDTMDEVEKSRIISELESIKKEWLAEEKDQNLQDKNIKQWHSNFFFAWRKYYAEKIMELNQ